MYIFHTCVGTCVRERACAHTHISSILSFFPTHSECVNIAYRCFQGMTFLKELCSIRLEDRYQGSNEAKAPGSLFWEDCELFGQFQVYFCLDQGEGLYDLWRAPCFQNSSENKKLLHLHTRLPSASLILILKTFALGHLEASEGWCLGFGLFSVWVLGPV